MSKPAKGRDSRQLLNLVLGHYYKRNGPIMLLHDVELGLIQLSATDANAVYTTLIRDGHIEHVMPNDQRFAAIHLASITAQGRVFHEQGGYRDESTVFDRIVKRAKNHPVLAWAIVVFTVLAAIAGLLGVVMQGFDFFRPK